MLIFFWHMQGGAAAVVAPSGGWKRGDLDFLGRQADKDAIRREEERLGIKPRQIKTLRHYVEKLAGGLALSGLPVQANQADLVAFITGSPVYAMMIQRLAIQDAERRAAAAELAIRIALNRAIELRDEEEAIMAILLTDADE